jgi:hypothetical protein
MELENKAKTKMGHASIIRMKQSFVEILKTKGEKRRDIR